MIFAVTIVLTPSGFSSLIGNVNLILTWMLSSLWFVTERR
uniref:Uncharacterized protein n=1 Tax=Arundo donax TaxID=35708 RepID=A0A0A9AMH6_ARUDO